MTHTHQHVIVDTDDGLDDALALLYLARTPQVHLVAVGSVHGNVTAPAAAHNALRALELLGGHSTPVTVGAEEPRAQSLHLRHPEDPFGTLAANPRPRPPPTSSFASLANATWSRKARTARGWS